jgi:AbrB family looped-hinge helix DNA binding protein
MATDQSRVTAQNQTSVPAAVRRRLGIGPGSELRWTIQGDAVLVSAKKPTLREIHQITSRRPVKHATAAQIRKGIVAGASRGHR